LLVSLSTVQACEQVYEMKPQELANIMWALASHEHLDERTAHVLGKSATIICISLSAARIF
jgi:hypothetical protein